MEPQSKLLEQARELLIQGHHDQVLDLVQHRDSKSIRNAGLHLRWADLLEEMGMIDQAVFELNLAIRDDPASEKSYVRLSEIYLDQGYPLKAARIWATLSERFETNPVYYQEWGSALQEAHEFEKARAVYQRALDRTGHPQFAALIKNLTFVDAPEEAPTQSESPDQLLPEKHHLVVFTALFSGREGVHARQWLSPGGEAGYSPVQDPFTPKIAENHILGNYTVGIYPVRLDNTVNFMVFDFDLAKFAVRKGITNKRVWDSMIAKVHETACRIVEVAANHELPLYLEDSGFKGRHAWIFLDTPVPAGVARKCGEMLLGEILPLPVEIHVEIFPRQGSVPQGSLGNLIKLPLGIHRRTGRRSIFITADGEPYSDQLRLLDEFDKASRRSVYATIQRLQATKHSSVTAAEKIPWKESEEQDQETALTEPTGRLPSIQESFDLDRDYQFQTIISRCAVLKKITDTINQTSMVTKEETQVLIHTIGHLHQGAEAVNELFR
ncbi:MAG: hypothetical protein JW902_09015, partial [Syntrophaceae bacterium]|nr:hypothetical protein [Syntrophaceae bacterium]